MSDLYEISDNNFNYYNYQPGSNIIIVHCKYITHAYARSRAHACASTHTPPSPPPYRLALFVGAQAVTSQKLLGRTETRTRDRMYCQTIRTIKDISRDDRARIATCRLRTPTVRQTDLRRSIADSSRRATSRGKNVCLFVYE